MLNCKECQKEIKDQDMLELGAWVIGKTVSFVELTTKDGKKVADDLPFCDWGCLARYASRQEPLNPPEPVCIGKVDRNGIKLYVGDIIRFDHVANTEYRILSSRDLEMMDSRTGEKQGPAFLDGHHPDRTWGYLHRRDGKYPPVKER